MQLKVLFGRKSHGRPDFIERKNNNKVVSFSTLFLMFTLKWITVDNKPALNQAILL